MDNKQLPQKESKAVVKKNSIIRELVTYAVKEEIEPRSRELMRNMVTGTFNMLNDSANKMVDKWLYPDGNAPSRGKRSGVGANEQNQYNKVFISNSSSQKPQRENNYIRSSSDLQLVWVEDPEDAKKIIAALIEEIDNYNKAKVSTFYEKVSEICHVHIVTNFTDHTHGWVQEDIPNMSYYRDRGKYFIDLPKPRNIESI